MTPQDLTQRDTPQPSSARPRPLAFAGPPLLVPAIAYVVLAVLGVIVPTAMAGESAYSSDAHLSDFYLHHGAAAHALAFFVMASAVPLVIWTAVASARVRALGYDVPGRMIALVGGTVAAALLTVSGAVSLALTQDHAADSLPVLRAMYGLSFAAGGPGFVMFIALLLLGISIPALLGRLVPRWIAWFGLVIAAISTIATLAVAFDGLDFLLPIGRFGSMIWLIAVGATLPSHRVRRADA